MHGFPGLVSIGLVGYILSYWCDESTRLDCHAGMPRMLNTDTCLPCGQPIPQKTSRRVGNLGDVLSLISLRLLVATDFAWRRLIKSHQRNHQASCTEQR
ncbi:hypothetical protein LY78DRAFT_476296 [Colletotrichum sublineola]|nr:hypothetical protein LY78DRAFT_476296 [Colletotrichum sublineola]